MRVQLTLDISTRDKNITLDDLVTAAAEHENIIVRTVAGEHMARIETIQRLPEEVQDALPEL